MATTIRVTLDDLRAYQDNWDGCGSERPSTLAIERAEEILSAQPEVKPSRMLPGGVIIRWRNGKRQILAELAITNEGTLELE